MKILCSCIKCHKEYATRGLHTHYDRSHGSLETRNKYFSGNHGKYNLPEYKIKLTKPIPQKVCPTCNTTFYHRINKFCNHSCSATFSNKQRDCTNQIISLKNTIKKQKEQGTYTNTGNSVRYAYFPFQYIKFKTCKCCSKFYIYPAPNTTPSYCSLICSKIQRSMNSSKTSKENSNCGGKRHSIRIPYIDSLNNKCTLDSTYELKVANELDKHNIKWIRPKHFWYHDKFNIKHRYHPDFYLLDYDVYLDPKNDYLIIKDQFKIQQVIFENNIKLLVLSKKQLTWNHIFSLI